MSYVFFLKGAFLAIIRIRDANATANDASSSIGTIIAFVAYSHQGGWSYVAIAYHTFTIACRRTENRIIWQ